MEVLARLTLQDSYYNWIHMKGCRCAWEKVQETNKDSFSDFTTSYKVLDFLVRQHPPSTQPAIPKTYSVSVMLQASNSHGTASSSSPRPSPPSSRHFTLFAWWCCTASKTKQKNNQKLLNSTLASVLHEVAMRNTWDRESKPPPQAHWKTIRYAIDTIPTHLSVWCKTSLF